MHNYTVFYRDYDDPWGNICDEAHFTGTPDDFDVYLGEMYHEWGVIIEGWMITD